MIDRLVFLSAKLKIVVAITLVGASGAAAPRPTPGVLATVEVIESSAESCRIALAVRGDVGHIEPSRLGGGRFVFDLAPVIWDGPTQRVRPEVPGIREYRFSQFSRDPPVTRLVVEVDAAWSCVHERDFAGIAIACGGPPLAASVAAPPTIAVVRGIALSSPVAGLDAEGLIERSLGFTPQDMVRDGLPNFGSTRDDWFGKPRLHKGLDIYVDHVTVQAAAAGRMVGTGEGKLAGGWAKIDHGDGVETVYVHISKYTIKKGQRVSNGQDIAVIDGAVGNAVQPQLHFELRLDCEAVDPIPYIFELASEDLKARITREERRLEALERERASLVQQSSRD